MNESLGSRVARIVSGSVHALVKAVEDAAPEAVLEEAIREVERATDDVRVELGREMAKKHLASTRLAEENRRHEDLSEKLELALKEGREDLAEVAASRQLDIEAQIPVLERTLAECGDHEKELESFLAALQARRRDMEEELTGFLESRKHAATGTGGPGAGSDIETRVDKAASTFEKVSHRNSGVVGGREGLESAAKLQELEDLARKNRVRERLEAARARMDRD